MHCTHGICCNGEINPLFHLIVTRVLDEQFGRMHETQMQDTNERRVTLSYWKLSGQKAGQSGL